MTFLKLAPFAQSYDFWIAVFLLMIASLIWLFIAWRQSRSGSIVTTFNSLGHRTETPSDQNISITKVPFFWFFLIHLIGGQLFFWIALWPDYQDVWFIK